MTRSEMAEMAVKMRGDGKTYRQIASHFKRGGFKAPSGKFYSTGGIQGLVRRSANPVARVHSSKEDVLKQILGLRIDSDTKVTLSEIIIGL